MAALVRALVATGLRRGLIGGSRAWLVAGGIAGALRLARRLWARQPVVETLELKPGQVLEVRHLRATHDDV